MIDLQRKKIIEFKGLLESKKQSFRIKLYPTCLLAKEIKVRSTLSLPKITDSINKSTIFSTSSKDIINFIVGRNKNKYSKKNSLSSGLSHSVAFVSKVYIIVLFVFIRSIHRSHQSVSGIVRVTKSLIDFQSHIVVCMSLESQFQKRISDYIFEVGRAIKIPQPQSHIFFISQGSVCPIMREQITVSRPCSEPDAKCGNQPGIPSIRIRCIFLPISEAFPR